MGTFLAAQAGFTHADTLRGSIGPYRAWWDVIHYDVTVKPDLTTKSIEGTTIITFRVLKEEALMQIDLQEPLVVDSIELRQVADANALGMAYRTIGHTPTAREGNVLWVTFSQRLEPGSTYDLVVTYHGVPREAKNPPWDGGWIWTTDARGNPWMSVACQGLGASVWYPCKDHQSDEPEGARLHIVVPDSLVGVGNGRFNSNTPNGDGTTTWHWHVSAPINNYNLVPYIGKYVRFDERPLGAAGPLTLDFWVLEENEEKAPRQFEQVPGMIHCFEEWFGPYPFYTDGYKLVEAPHLGMEHQSGIAYGNKFQNGYLGRDLSGTGHGLKWDFIIVHESGHEWFGNSITTADIADMWVHEGFTQYTEVLMTECLLGRQAAEEYVIGLRRNIRNDKPMIAPYGVNAKGSGDMYPKGANLVHTVRRIIGDSAFKGMLREMNSRYRHSIVTSAEIEHFISGCCGVDLTNVFDQYLRTTQVPTLEWGVRKKQLFFRWAGTVEGFGMPVDVRVDDATLRLSPATAWQRLDRPRRIRRVEADPGYYINVRQEKAPRTSPPRTGGGPPF